ncbi:NADH-quinone oxidoreductase subunit A [Hazenella sp. IB182357]|uniref:NADH-quinone oxidoreductase subunit A n=1 Tax=Polycladospora coralii TaxID=2771432 RepID=A0A926N971_9BACL|nr:NADH-quinone oxidoreductase subunit A [Polycladospora coralii]MBD1372142.1 NADH-quinone oxidoreductase subunit A [Polycladospora coralii]MBS7530648.1 NADH-quinone oxidoreductase subunit A [Polycladospora coralii]
MQLDENILYLFVFFVIGIALPLVALSLGKILRPNRPSTRKSVTYESGVEPTGESWVQFNVRYYLFALLFVIFDVESVFLYPWAVVYQELRADIGLFVLVEMLIFILFLLIGLAYAWKKKVLSWK